MRDRQQIATESSRQTTHGPAGLDAGRDHAEVPGLKLVPEVGEVAAVHGLVREQPAHDLGAALLVRARPASDLHRAGRRDLRLQADKQRAHRSRRLIQQRKQPLDLIVGHRVATSTLGSLRRWRVSPRFGARLSQTTISSHASQGYSNPTLSSILI